MFISDETINALAKVYGKPKEVSFSFETSTEEYERIKSSQKKGREHDVTLYIHKENKIIVVAKHFYPKGLFRAPSGGINVGEDFIAGAKREAKEETGCEIELEHFLLKTNVDFKQVDSPNVIKWYSYIFQAKYISGDFKFTDKKEIRELALVSLDEFESYSKTMRSLPVAGLHYRAAMHDEVKKLLQF